MLYCNKMVKFFIKMFYLILLFLNLCIFSSVEDDILRKIKESVICDENYFNDFIIFENIDFLGKHFSSIFI